MQRVYDALASLAITCTRAILPYDSPATDLRAGDAAAYACRPNVIRRGFQQTRPNELRWTR